MKRICVIIKVLLIFSITAIPQENIKISIQKEIRGGNTYIITNITNNNDVSIMIPGLVIRDGKGLTSSVSQSYIIAAVYNASGKKLENEEIKNSFYETENSRAFITVKPGESFERIDFLKHGDGNYGLVSKSILPSVKFIEIVAHLKYIPLYPKEKDQNKVIEKDFISNRINL